MRRRLLLPSMTLVLTLMVATAVMAKTPGFDLVVSSETPAPGETVTVEVTLDQQFPAEELSGLLGLFPIAEVGEDLRPIDPYGFTAVALPRVADGLYRGTFKAPSEPGEYVLVPFPNIGHNFPETDAYPKPLVLSVQRPGSSGVPLSAGVGGAAALIAVGLTAAYRRREAFST